MARNGSGTYSNPYPNFVSGTVISSSQVDANNSDIAAALTQSIAVDGQSTVTGNIPLSTNKLTGLGAGSAATDSLNLGQAQAEAMHWCGTAGGSADAITLSPSPAITAYAAGQRFVWKASSNVNTGATTVAISGLGTIALQDNGAALVAGNHAANKIFMGILDTTSTVQIMQVQISGTDPLIVSSLTVSGDALIGDDLTLNSDAAVLGFGENTDVTLTHVHDTGLLLNSTRQLQFNDASQYINAPSATVLDINATDEVEVNATLMDVNANLDVSGTIVGASTLQATTITATTAVVPDASDGAALGTTSLEWSDLYLADGAVVGFGDDQDVTLTHVADTGLLLSSTDQLQFGDSGTYIHQSADGVLDLVSDTEIELNATTIDINGAVALNGAITGATNITLSGELDAGSLDISGNADIDGTLFVDAIDVDGAVQIDGTVTVGVDDQGYDFKLFGDTASAYLLWDTSADKLLTAGAATIDVVKDKLLIGGTAVTTTAAELNFNDTASAGTVVASKTVVVDANKDIASFRNITLTGELDAATLDISGNADIDGTTNLDAVDIDGAVQIDGTVTVGVDDQGYDFKLFGDTASAYLLWDTSTDDLILGGAAKLGIGTTAPYTTSNAQIAGTTSTSTTSNDASNPPSAGQLDIHSTDAYSTQRGGKISFSGVSGDTGSTVQDVYGSIEGRKKNATNNHLGGQLVFKTTLNSTGVIYEHFSLGDEGEAVFNEQGWTTGDFRVESDTNSHQLFVDASANRVGIGDSSPSDTLSVAGSATITTADNTTQLTLVSTDADANAGPILDLWRNSASPAANDLLGEIYFYGEDDAGNKQEYSSIKSKALDVSSGAEKGRFEISNFNAGVSKSVLLATSPASNEEIVINEDSADYNFRVESNDVVNMLHVDAGSNTVGVGISAVTSPNTMEIWANNTGTEGVLFINQYGTGDPAIRLSTQAVNSFVGLDNSDGDTFKIDVGTSAIGGQTGFSIDTSGNVKLNFSTGKTYITSTGGSAGELFIGGTTVRNAGAVNIDYAGNSQCAIGMNDTDAANASKFTSFLSNGTVIGSITNNNNSAVAYNTTSDYRLKENVNYTFDATSRLKQLKPARFNWIADETNAVVDGFLAHEVSNIVPEAIDGEKDAVEDVGTMTDSNGEQTENVPKNQADDSGNSWVKTGTKPVHQGIDQSKLVPLLVKTIQELEARIAALESA